MKIALVVLAAILSVVFSEVGLFIWLRASSRWMDITGSFFLRGVLPVELIVVTLQTLALWKIYRSAPLRYGLIYGGTYALLHCVFLQRLNNPPADLARYLVTDLGAAALIIGGCWLLFWRHRAAA